MKKIISLLMLPLLLLTLAMPVRAEDNVTTITDPLTSNAGNFTSYGGSWEFTEEGYSQLDSMVSGSSWHYGSYFKNAYEDFDLSFSMKLKETGDPEGYAGILFRKTKPNDTLEFSGYALVLKEYGQLALYDWTKSQVIFSIPLDNPLGWHDYKIEANGFKMKFYVDGELRHSIANDAFSSGYISFTTATASAIFADFEITGKSIGSADSIGKVGDGNMDKAASDLVFEERAKIDTTEQGEEPAWFTTMIEKLNSGETVQSSTDSNSILKIAAYVVSGVAVVLLVLAIAMSLKKKGNAKVPVALLLALATVVTPLAVKAAEEDDALSFNEADYEKVFYISPEGDDSNNGSIEAPFLTLRKAQEAVRSVSANQQGDIAVVLRDGTYTLGSQLVFDEADSGQNGHDIVWMSYPGELVKISGGQQITGWTETENNIWKAQTELSDIDSLYINDVRAEVASSGTTLLDLLYYDQENNCVVIYSEDAGEIQGGSVMLYQDWQTHVMNIAEVKTVEDNPTATQLIFTESGGELFFKAGSEELRDQCTKYVLQNDMSLLDEAGEYYYDKATKTLYYIPRAGEDMNEATVYAPALNGLVRIQGSSTDSHVQNLVFEGLVFEYSGFAIKQAEGDFIEYQASHHYVRDNGTNYPDMDVPTAAIHIQNADNIDIERSVIRHSGGNGVNFYHSVYDSNLDGSIVTDISGSGVMLGVYATGILPGDLYQPTNPEETAVHNVNITNNVVTWTGREFKGGCNIANILGYEILIRNNEVAYGTYTGISNGWGWSTKEYVVKENTIAYNDVHHVAMSAVDVAGFYNLNAQKGTQIRANYFHDIQRAGTGRAGAPVYGIYLDEGTNDIIVTDNVSVNNYSNEINFHNTGGSIYSLGNDTLNEETIANAGVGNAYASISLRKSVEGGSEMIQNVSLGQPSNSIDGEVGMKITVDSDVTVTALGRFYYLGNSEDHKITIYDASGKEIASTTVNMADGTVSENGFKYAALNKEIKLKAGNTYYVVSSETVGGDVWMNRDCQAICSEHFSIEGGVTCKDGKWDVSEKPGAGYMNGPVSLIFSE